MKLAKLKETILSLTVAGLIAGCGGSGGSNGSGGGTQLPTPPPPAAQLTITSTTATLPLGLVGSPYTTQLVAVDGVGALTWTVLPWMPPGLTVSKTGLISGTPSSPTCPTTMNVTVTDSGTPMQTASSTIQFSAAGLNGYGGRGQVGVFENDGVAFECATYPVAWSLVAGLPPPGVQLLPFAPGDLQLDFQGIPTRAGSYSVTVQGTDAIKRTAQQSYSIIIIPPPLVIDESVMQLGVVNQAFDHVISASGGTPPYGFKLSSGALAPGIQLNANTGDISGIPTTAGFYQFRVTVTDNSPNQLLLGQTYSILVTPAALPKRNDTLLSATPIFPGTYPASLSPYTDSAGNAAPDQDYYSVIGNGGDIYAIATSADHSAATVPAIEILDSTGTRMTTCNDPLAENPPPGAPFPARTATFSDPCVNYVGQQFPYSSYLKLQLPPGSNQTFYIHVFDFYGRARPDFIYGLSVVKLN